MGTWQGQGGGRGAGIISLLSSIWWVAGRDGGGGGGGGAGIISLLSFICWVAGRDRGEGGGETRYH